MPVFATNLKALPEIFHAFGIVDDCDKPGNLFYCAQQNGSTVIELANGEKAGVIAGDAIFTRTTQPIAVITADCLPILLSSTESRFVAAIHGGWQGLAGGIIENSFNSFRSAGVSLDSLRIAIGPAIQPCCYEIGLNLVEKIESVHGHLWRGKVAPWSASRRKFVQAISSCKAPVSNNEAWLNLVLYCFYLLEAAGVDVASVQAAETCTYCAGPRWGSYRRRTHQGGEKTFQYSWIGLQKGDSED